jgi:hypothetical protein
MDFQLAPHSVSSSLGKEMHPLTQLDPQQHPPRLRRKGGAGSSGASRHSLDPVPLKQSAVVFCLRDDDGVLVVISTI